VVCVRGDHACNNIVGVNSLVSAAAGVTVALATATAAYPHCVTLRRGNSVKSIDHGYGAMPVIHLHQGSFFAPASVCLSVYRITHYCWWDFFN